MISNTILKFLITILFLINGYQFQDSNQESEIIATLKEFYVSYITENSNLKPNVEKINQIKNKYCTKRFLKKIKADDLDYDPILNAQDCDILWLNTLSFRKTSIDSNIYTVSYVNDNKKENTIKILIKKEGNSIKIDSIL